MRDFGARLRRLRESRRLSQRELADLIGVRVMQVNRYERGENLPSAVTLPSLARVFGLTVEQLIDEKGQPLEAPSIRHPTLLDRFRRIDQEIKDRRELDTIISFLDAFLAKREIQRIAASA